MGGTGGDGYAGAGGDGYAGAGGFAGDYAGAGGDSYAGAGGFAGAGADPCVELLHDPSAYCGCYYPINRPDYFACVAQLAPNGEAGVGGAAGAAGGCAGASGDPAYDECAGELVDAGAPPQ